MKLTLLIVTLTAFCSLGQAPAPPPDVKFPDIEVSKPESAVLFVNCDAEFPGGTKALLEHIHQYLDPIEKGQIGDETQRKRGSVTFIVETDGRLIDIKIHQEVSSEMDDIMLRIVEEMPRWTPACDQFGPVRSRVRLPFIFFYPEE